MSKLAASVALDAKVFVRQFKALISVAEALEEIGNIEKYKSEAVGRRAKATDEIVVLETELKEERAKLVAAKSLVKEASDKAEDRKKLDDHTSEAIIAEAKSKAKHILLDVEGKVKAVEAEHTMRKDTLIDENGVLLREQKELEKKLAKLKGEMDIYFKSMDALKARF